MWTDRNPDAQTWALVPTTSEPLTVSMTVADVALSEAESLLFVEGVSDIVFEVVFTFDNWSEQPVDTQSWTDI